METSFLTEQEIQDITEGLIARVMKETKGIEVTLPFPRMKYDDAMALYGSDKPDTRFDMLLQDLTEVVKGVDFKVFSEAPAVKAIVVKGAADNYSRKDIDKMTAVAKQYGAKGLAWVKVVDSELNGPVAKFLTGIQADLTAALGLEDKDLVLFVADTLEVANATLGALGEHHENPEEALRNALRTYFLVVAGVPTPGGEDLDVIIKLKEHF